jgi:hypothetical protein
VNRSKDAVCAQRFLIFGFVSSSQCATASGAGRN